MTLNQAIEKKVHIFQRATPQAESNVSRHLRLVEFAHEIAALAQSPLMLKEIQEKTRREALEEAARVCKEQIVYNSLPNPDIEYGLGFEEARRVITAAIRALATKDTV